MLFTVIEHSVIYTWGLSTPFIRLIRKYTMAPSLPGFLLGICTAMMSSHSILRAVSATASSGAGAVAVSASVSSTCTGTHALISPTRRFVSRYWQHLGCLARSTTTDLTKIVKITPSASHGLPD